jgi:hypothetical protein
MNEKGFSFNPANFTYTINSKKYSGVLYATLTLPRDIDAEVEAKLASMNDDFVDAKKVIESVKNGNL